MGRSFCSVATWFAKSKERKVCQGQETKDENSFIDQKYGDKKVLQASESTVTLDRAHPRMSEQDGLEPLLLQHGSISMRKSGSPTEATQLQEVFKTNHEFFGTLQHF